MKIKRFKAKNFAEALKLVKKELSEDAIILSSTEKKGKNPYVEVTAAVDYEIDDVISEQLDREAIEEGILPPDEPEKAAVKTETEEKKRSSFRDVFRKEPMEARSKPAAPPVSPEPVTPQSPLQKPPQTFSQQPPQPAPQPQIIVKEPDKRVFETHENNVKKLIKTMSDDMKKETDGLKNEIETLRDTIQDMKSVGYEVDLTPKKKKILRYLKERAISEEYALRLCSMVRDISELPKVIEKEIEVKGGTTNRKAIMLIGPTGVGKTTTVAKLVASTIKSGQKAAILNLDTYRIGAVEQSRIYSRIMGIPLEVASSVDEFKAGLLKLDRSRDIIFIDSTGRNPKDDTQIEEYIDACSSDIQIELHLLMSANSDNEFMLEAYKHYKKLPINYIGFTKIDEAVRYGAIYNLLLTYQKPVAYITTGQKVPDDIEFPTIERLVSLVLKKESYD